MGPIKCLLHFSFVFQNANQRISVLLFPLSTFGICIHTFLYYVYFKTPFQRKYIISNLSFETGRAEEKKFRNFLFFESKILIFFPQKKNNFRKGRLSVCSVFVLSMECMLNDKFCCFHLYFKRESSDFVETVFFEQSLN